MNASPTGHAPTDTVAIDATMEDSAAPRRRRKLAASALLVVVLGGGLAYASTRTSSDEVRGEGPAAQTTPTDVRFGDIPDGFEVGAGSKLGLLTVGSGMKLPDPVIQAGLTSPTGPAVTVGAFDDDGAVFDSYASGDWSSKKVADRTVLWDVVESQTWLVWVDGGDTVMMIANAVPDNDVWRIAEQVSVIRA